MRFRLFVCAATAFTLTGCFTSNVIDDPGTTTSTILPALENAPYDSLAGARLSFQRFATTAGSFRGIYLIDGTARRVQSLLAGRTLDRAMQNPTTGQLVYGGQTNTGNSLFDLYTTRLTDSVETRLTSGVEFENYPTWSIDGASIYYNYRGNGYSVFVHQAPTAGAVRDSLILPDSQSNAWNIDSPPAVSATGRLGYVVRNSLGWSIWALDYPSGANRVQLRSDPRSGFGPLFQGVQFSPDGTKLAFLALNYDLGDQLNSTTLKIMDASGTNEVSIVTVTTLPFSFPATSLTDFSVCWLSASRIAFTAVGNDRASHVYIAHIVGAAAVTLTQVTTNSGVFDRGVSCRP